MSFACTFADMSSSGKTISVVFLTSLLLVRSLLVPFILMDFTLRQDYIATYLCENRDKPSLHCDGKCYLAKKLKAAHEAQDREASQRLLNQILDGPAQLLTLHFVFPERPVKEARSSVSDTYHCVFPEAASLRFFQPPRFI